RRREPALANAEGTCRRRETAAVGVSDAAPARGTEDLERVGHGERVGPWVVLEAAERERRKTLGGGPLLAGPEAPCDGELGSDVLACVRERGREHASAQEGEAKGSAESGHDGLRVDSGCRGERLSDADEANTG